MKNEKDTKDIILDLYCKYLALDKKNLASVSDFCKTMNISRSTFYSYFDGLWEVVDSLKIRHKIKLNNLYCSVNDCEMNFDVFFPLYLNFIKENILYYQIYFKVYSLDEIEFNVQMNKIHFKKLMNIPDDGKIENEYLFSTYFVGFQSFISHWIKGGYKESVDELTAIAKSIFISLNK